MATKKITDLTLLAAGSLSISDYFVVVDVSDTTMASSGTDKKITTDSMLGATHSYGNIGDGSFSTTTAGNQVQSGTNPKQYYNKSNAATNEKLWVIDVGSTTWELKTRTDADAAGANILSATRSGTAMTNLTVAPALICSSSISIGGGTAILKILTATATLDFPSITSQSNQDLTISVTGAKVGDAVALALPAAPLAGVAFMGYVSAADTVTIRAMNYSSSAKDPVSATYRATVYNYT